MLVNVNLLSKNGQINLDNTNYNSTFDKPINIIYEYINVRNLEIFFGLEFKAFLKINYV